MVENILSNVNPLYANFTYNIKKLSSGETAINISYYYAVDVFKNIIHVEINFQKDKNDRNYEKQILKSAINVCRMSEGTIGDFMAKMIMENIHQYMNFDLRCPFKKVS